MPDKEKIRSLFDRIAPGYDAFNHISTLGIDKCWRKRAVRCIADSHAPLQVLDVATGTGDFALAIATRLADGSAVTGVDLSEGMLAVGRQKVAAAGFEAPAVDLSEVMPTGGREKRGSVDCTASDPTERHNTGSNPKFAARCDDNFATSNISVDVHGLSSRIDSPVKSQGVSVVLQQADVEALPFAVGSFDRVSVAFGVRNFENLERGLSEMCRVLRSGGRLVILELSYPDNAFILSLYKLYAFHFLPWLGNLLTGNKAAFQYLPASIMRFPKPPVLIPMLRSAGFSSVAARSFTFGVCRMYLAEK